MWYRLADLLFAWNEPIHHETLESATLHAKRSNKHGSELLTFLWRSDVPSDNNAGERAIRPAVLIRKKS